MSPALGMGRRAEWLPLIMIWRGDRRQDRVDEATCGSQSGAGGRPGHCVQWLTRRLIDVLQRRVDASTCHPWRQPLSKSGTRRARSRTASRSSTRSGRDPAPMMIKGPLRPRIPEAGDIHRTTVTYCAASTELHVPAFVPGDRLLYSLPYLRVFIRDRVSNPKLEHPTKIKSKD